MHHAMLPAGLTALTSSVQEEFLNVNTIDILGK
jgi:hypothetical protein